MSLVEDDSEMLLVLLICVCVEADVQVVLLCDGVRVLLDLDLL